MLLAGLVGRLRAADTVVYSSGSARMLVPLQSYGCRLLLTPGSRLARGGLPGKEVHQLVYGELLLAAAGELGSPAPMPFKIGSLDISFVPGSMVLETSKNGTSWSLHVLSGQAKALRGAQAIDLPPGTTLIGRPGAEPSLQRSAPEILQRHALLLQAMARDPLPTGPDTPLKGVVSVQAMLQPGGSTVEAAAIDPALKPLTTKAWVGNSQQFEPRKLSANRPPSIILPPGSSRALVTQVDANGYIEELSLEVKFESVPEGYRLQNRLWAGVGNHVRAQLDANFMLVTSRGAGVVVEQTVDADHNPLDKPRVRVLSGHVFLEARKLGPRPSLNAKELEMRGSSFTLDAVGAQQLQMHGIYLVTEPRQSGQKIIEDLSHLMGYSADAAEAPRVLTLLKKIPGSADQILNLLPIHSPRLSKAAQIKITFLRAVEELGVIVPDLWRHELESAAIAHPLPMVEVLSQGAPISASSLVGASTCHLYSFDGADPWRGVPMIESIEQQLSTKKVVRSTASFQMLGRISLGLIVFCFLGIVIFVMREQMMSRRREKMYCPNCAKVMDRIPVLTGDPVADASLFEHLRLVERVRDADEAEKFRSKAHKLMGAAPSGAGSMLLEASAYWCPRCEEGILAWHLVRQGAVADESESAFNGLPAFQALRVLGQPRDVKAPA